LCEDYNVNVVINLTNTAQVYDKDPNEFADAKPIGKMSWDEFRELVGDKWVPGMHAPFDPIAAKKAQGLGAKVIIMSGSDFDNVGKFLNGEEFLGTVIE
jgi:uridylate kinase